MARIFSLAAVCLFALGAVPSAASPRWVQASPYGGSIAALAQAPSAPEILYAYAQPGGLFASDDGGATWHSRAGFPAEGGALPEALLVSPGDAQTVYALVASSLLRTRDGGEHWSAFGPESPFVFGLALDAADSRTVYAATLDGLFRSADGGDTWSVAGFAGTMVSAVAIDPRNGELFAAVSPDRGGVVTLWTSADQGGSWSVGETLDPQLSLVVPHFVFDSARPGAIYVHFRDGDGDSVMFRSADDGAAWQPLPAAPPANDLVVSPDGTLFAATDLGAVRSEDGGDTWIRLPLGTAHDAMRRILVSSAPQGGLLAAGSAGVWKSGPHGRLWVASSRGIVAMYAFCLSVAPVGPAAVYAVTSAGIFRSADQGSAWTRVHSNLVWPYPLAIQMFDPRQPRTMYGFGTDGQADFIVKSTDGAETWRKLPLPFTCSGSVCEVGMTGLALDPGNPDRVYVAGSYFYHFGGSGNFLWRSDDGFVTREKLRPLAGLVGLFIAPERNGAMYGVTCRWLYKSEDSASSWRRAGRGLPRDLCLGTGGGQMAFDPRDPLRIYISSGTQGVYVSADGGETFRPMSRGLEGAQVAMLLIDPKNPANLYASVATKGVFRWSAASRTWTPVGHGNEGLPLGSFQGVLALDPQNPSILYAGTTDQGVFRIDLAD